MRGDEAERATRVFWELRREEVLVYLLGRRFSKKAADLAFHNFIETMCYVAAQTCEVGFKQTSEHRQTSTVNLIEDILASPSLC